LIFMPIRSPKTSSMAPAMEIDSIGFLVTNKSWWETLQVFYIAFLTMAN
jgi:hypothetical protein